MRTDQQLLEATPRSAAAFGEFYRRYERAVAAYLMSQARDPDLAADLTSETFAAAFVGVRRFPKDVPPRAWLLGIARHQWLQAIRRNEVDDRARRRLGLTVNMTDEVRERFEQLAGDERATQILEDLPPDQASAVRQRVLDDASYESIAATLRCSPSLARQRVSRGLRILRTRQEQQ